MKMIPPPSLKALPRGPLRYKVAPYFLVEVAEYYSSMGRTKIIERDNDAITSVRNALSWYPL